MFEIVQLKMHLTKRNGNGSSVISVEKKILLLQTNISKSQITKVGLLEKRELNEEFFNQLYPNQEIKTEADFRNKISEENPELLEQARQQPDQRPGISSIG